MRSFRAPGSRVRGNPKPPIVWSESFFSMRCVRFGNPIDLKQDIFHRHVAASHHTENGRERMDVLTLQPPAKDETRRHKKPRKPPMQSSLQSGGDLFEGEPSFTGDKVAARQKIASLARLPISPPRLICTVRFLSPCVRGCARGAMKRKAMQSKDETAQAFPRSRRAVYRCAGFSQPPSVRSVHPQRPLLCAALGDAHDGNETARKFPLLTADGVPVVRLAEAKEAADVLRNDRRMNALPTTGHKPKFADYVETYFAKPTTASKKSQPRQRAPGPQSMEGTSWRRTH